MSGQNNPVNYGILQAINSQKQQGQGQQGNSQQGVQNQPSSQQGQAPVPGAAKIVAVGQAPQQPQSSGGGGGIGGLLGSLGKLTQGVSQAMNSPVPGIDHQPAPQQAPGQPMGQQGTQQPQKGQYSVQGVTGQQGGAQQPQTALPQQSNQFNQAGVLQKTAVNSQIFNNAMQQMGVKSNDPTLMNYLAKANPGLDPKNTPWCAGFVGSVLNASGVKGTGSLAARSYLNYGTATQNPQQGDIVVFKDLTGANNPNHGHVGFVANVNKNTGQVFTLGGNQSGGVDIKSYPMSSVLGFRTPPSGSQVQQYAQQNGIGNPQDLAQTTISPQERAQKLMGQVQPNSQLAYNGQGTNALPQQNQTALPKTNNPFTSTQQMNPQQLQQQFQNHNLPRGLRNNNPGNIESSINAPGQIKGGDPRFAQFQTPQQGLNALSGLLTNKYDGQSLTQIINKYAPPHENDTKAYINTLAKSTGLDPNKPVDMSNPNVKASIMQGIIKIENGHNPYSTQQIQQAVQQSGRNKNVSLNNEEPLIPGYMRMPQNVPNQQQPNNNDNMA